MGGRSLEFTGKSKIFAKMVENAINKRIFYIPYASKEFSKSFNKFVSECPDEAEVILATEEMLKDISLFEAEFKAAGTIFIAGGSINYLMEIAKRYKLTDIFIKYLDSNKIYAGVSAGAIFYSKFGMGDRDVFLDNGHYYNFKMVEGIGLLPITVCPHYQKEDLILYDDVAKNYPYDGYCIEDDTALFINSNNYDIIKEARYNSIYILKKDEGYKLISLYERTWFLCKC